MNQVVLVLTEGCAEPSVETVYLYGRCGERVGDRDETDCLTD
jgi:hypothetical protein